MAPLALPLLLLLLSLSSSSLLNPVAAVCAPRSSPYQALFDHYLPAPAVGDDTTDFDDDDSPSPSPSPSVNSPAPPTPSATSPSPAPKASAPAVSAPKPSTTLPSPAPKASAPVAPTTKPSTTSPSPAPKASAPVSTPKPPATSPSMAPKSATATPTPAPKASPSGSSDDKHTPSTVDVHGKVVGAVADVMAGVSSDSGVLDLSLKPICGMVPYPAICEANVKAAAPKSLQSVDVRSAFTLMMEAYTDEIRDIRDKSRALATNDLYSDPLNSCNRSLGYMLRTSKEMVTSFESDDGGALKSGMDALVNSLMSCKEKPTAIKNDMVRLYNIWDNIEAIFEKLYPALDPDKLFPRDG